MSILNVFRRKLEAEQAAYETIKEETVIFKEPDAPQEGANKDENDT